MKLAEPIIREAKPGDEAGIHESHMRSIREVCIKDHGEAEIQVWGNRPLGSRWIEAIREGYVWVVEYKGQIQGHGYLKLLEREAHIQGLYLTPEILGKGLGKRLAALMIEVARRAKAETVSLDSTLTAHGFYRRLGFRDTGPIESSPIGGSDVRSYPMRLQL